MAAKDRDAVKNKLNILDEMSKNIPLVSEGDYEVKLDPIPSGSLSLDLAIGIGGYPRGAIVDIFGSESAGKSLLSIMAIAQIQKQGGVAVVWDAERSYSKNLEWMRINGVDTSKLRFLKLKSDEGAEIGLSSIEQICKKGAADLIVIDSIPSLIPQKALEKDLTEEARIGARASLLTPALSRLAAICDDSKTTVMCINQMRCIPANAIMVTDNGFKYAKDLKVGDKLMHGDDTRTIKNIVDSGVVEGVKIKTFNAGSITISNNHRHMVLSDGEFVVKLGSEIVEGDILISPRQEVCSVSENKPILNINIGGKEFPLDENLAFLMGAAIFCMTYDKNSSSIGFCPYDNYNLSKIKDALDKVVPSNLELKFPWIYVKDTIFSTHFPEIIKRENKYIIPDEILYSKRSVISAYLRGIMCKMKIFSNNIRIKVPKEIAEDIMLLMHSFGIPSVFETKYDVLSNSTHIQISGRYLTKLETTLGYKHPKFSVYLKENEKTIQETEPFCDYYAKPLAKNCSKVIRDKYRIDNPGKNPPIEYNGYLDKMVFSMGGHRSKTLQLLEGKGLKGHDIYEKVKSFRFYKVVDVQKKSFKAIDIEVDKDSLFCYNKFLTHNSNIGGGLYQPTEKETSIFALKHFSTLRMRVKKASKPVIEKEVPVGHRVHVDIIKNKAAAPSRQAEFFINYFKGVDNKIEMAEILLYNKMAKMSGGWIEFNGKKYHGIDEFADIFKDKDLYSKTLSKIKSVDFNVFGFKGQDVGTPESTLNTLTVEGEE